MWRRIARVLAVAGVCVHPPALAGQAPAVDDEPSFAIRYSLKSSALLARMPADPALFPERNSATGFWRVRAEPTWRWNGITWDLAFEQRVRAYSSASTAAGAGVLPPEADGPFRIRQLDWAFATAAHGEWRGEVDRAAMHVSIGRSEVTVGRQAVGWGRGALFGAVDLFAPFTPLEVDREWRRGVDAVRADVKLTSRMSLDSVAAFADALDRSAFATRLRGYAGKADVEVLGGYRAGDVFAGVTSSAPVGDFEVHGELAAFRTEADAGSTVFGVRRTIVKAVAGGSYRLPVGNGALLYAEYHYSGFGAASPDQIVRDLQDRAFQERYLRGDMQILGRHALAVLGSYELSPELTTAAQWVLDPSDGSGVLVPSATWTVNDRWSVLFSAYAPYGRGPAEGTLNSAFGASPRAVFVQIRLYR